MAKNIVLLSDGTGNTSIKGRGTNVFKMFEAIDLTGHQTHPELTPQVAFYDDGVGTESFKPLKIFAGMTGFGLGRNVRQLYRELVRIYDPGDRIFLFGFSRGAFTVRTLAGLIANCGILDCSRLPTSKALGTAVDRAYEVYRKRYRTALMKLVAGPPDTTIIETFRSRWCLPEETTIHFLGVWDTVDAVGTPFHISDFINLAIRRFKFPDRSLNRRVENARHAIALDDERHSFHPLLWEEDASDAGRIEQVWFAGAHSNVGGGYPKQGMSLVALNWMMRQAMDAGLRFTGSDRLYCSEHTNVDDKLYDPRSGLGVFYRWKPRSMEKLCRDNGVHPKIHCSVLERIAHGTEDYAPGNIAPDAAAVITSTGDPDRDEAALRRALEVEEVLRKAHRDGRPLLARVRAMIFIGHISYYVYLIFCTLVAGAAIMTAASAIRRGARSMSPSDVLWFLVLLLSGFLLSYALGRLAQARMSAVFSEFWHEEQQRLREALKRARAAS